jgi:hypothetical protein
LPKTCAGSESEDGNIGAIKKQSVAAYNTRMRVVPADWLKIGAAAKKAVSRVSGRIIDSSQSRVRTPRSSMGSHPHVGDAL